VTKDNFIETYKHVWVDKDPWPGPTREKPKEKIRSEYVQAGPRVNGSQLRVSKGSNGRRREKELQQQVPEPA
jgi:hypothetical protein